MAKKHGPNKENLEATRRLFLQIARKEFSIKGYYDASTASIVEESGMARGSLYYHFGDKKGLFRAVYEELMHEMRESVRTVSDAAKTPWDSLMAGSLQLLDLCTEDKTRRIVIDVHTALTYKERLEILHRTLLQDLLGLINNVMAVGYFKGHDLRALGIMIFGILSESGRSFELAEDIPAARAIVGKNFATLMEAARG